MSKLDLKKAKSNPVQFSSFLNFLFYILFKAKYQVKLLAFLVGFMFLLLPSTSFQVYELMRQWNGAITSYSKAITLLTFILVEAASLPLNPPFSLSPSNQHRIRKYIMNLRTHLYNSQMTVRHPGEQQ